MKYALLLLFIFPLPSNANELTVADYYKLLPKAYRNYYADVAETRLETDIRNGWLAIFAQGRDGPLFEMALFRDAQGEALLLVTNTQSDPACTFYQSHALRYRHGAWQAQSDVLPPPDPGYFFAAPEALALLQKAPDYLAWHYQLPRYGTELKLTFGEPCDMVEGLSAEDYARFVELHSDKVQRFRWNRAQGGFDIVPGFEG